jgi:thiamine kinase-like enzyme
MRAAAEVGLAPNVAALDAAAGILLADYRANARAWTPTDARQPRNVERVAALLRELHALDVQAPTFAAERIARGYLDSLVAAVGAGRTRFDAREQTWADELLEHARHYDATHRATALCHNDLVAANVVDDGRLVLVDFEYAVRAAPVLDLAGLAAMNDYGARERRAVLGAYRGDGALAIAEPDLDRTMRLVRLVSFFWARLGELRAADSAPYRELAAEIAAQLR